ncbi:MAG: efflux RND transporter periplasmic adaptor subunit [Gammaproteobacteria bacterium]
MPLSILLVLILFFTLPHTGVAAEPARVRVTLLREIASYPIRSAPATALSINDAQISAEIGARVEKLHVRVGDVVDSGGILANLDCASYDYRAAAERAKLAALNARIKLAGRRLKRTETLARQQSVADELLDERRSELQILEAERGELRAQYSLATLDGSRCVVSTAFRALVTERLAAEGEYLSIGDPILRVLDIDNVEVSAQIQFGDLASIEASAKLWFQHSDERYPVQIRATLAALNTVTRNQEMRLIFVEKVALPGAAGQLFWHDRRPHVPGNLLVQRDVEMGIFILEDKRAKFVAVPNGAPGRAVPVSLPENTRVITEGFYSLSNGDSLTVDETE